MANDENDETEDNAAEAEMKSISVNVRDGFVASSDEYELVAADFSQMEMRILAQLSEDEKLLSLFQQGEGGDIYRMMASACFGVPLEQVTEELRSRAKTISLGIIYGMVGCMSLQFWSCCVKREEIGSRKLGPKALHAPEDGRQALCCIAA